MVEPSSRNTGNWHVTDYDFTSLAVLNDLPAVGTRPNYYLIGNFDHVNPISEHDILWSWSQGFLATTKASLMLTLEEGDTIEEIALQLSIPLPIEEAISREEAAAILCDEPVRGDPLFHVRGRIRDGRLTSYRRSDVEARRLFEAQSSADRNLERNCGRPQAPTEQA